MYARPTVSTSQNTASGYAWGIEKAPSQNPAIARITTGYPFRADHTIAMTTGVFGWAGSLVVALRWKLVVPIAEAPLDLNVRT